ncbi:hypothetical protein BDV30DRAFT_206180 [Aspergillus minisclerotigenes]|uniref:F-box domain-containing protein n=1 Tax=Aspergillus minisclerotigenes TaxID=656917 RepID=A0A5N6JFA7_9EURO|nr:hypothetical protein BDV30DRAFT_206180 [Aspergillus minisclerotigenes]
MKNLRNNTSHGCLVFRSLSLQGLEDADPDDGYEAEAKLFEITMLALSSSKLPVQMLDIFADSCSHLTPSLCALVCCKIMATMNKVNLSSSFRGCKILSLRMSHCSWDIDEEFRSPLSLDQAREHTIFICDSVNMFPVLEEFYLAWEYQDLALSDALDAEEHFFDRIADSCESPFLKKCTLQNIRTSETAMLLFLHKVQLTSLSMKKVFLNNGQFGSIFCYLSTSMPNLDYLYLCQLYQEPGTVY